MVARKLGRYAAPTGLAAVIVATVVVVSSGLDGGTGKHRAAVRQPVRTVLAVHAPSRSVFYVVRSGDSLSTISVRTGVSVPELEALNPSADPNALQTGQRLRLRR